MPYPSWRYHKSLEARIIHSEAEEAEGWLDSPARFEKHECKEGETYKEHQEAWESKEEKKKPGRPKKEKA